MCALNNNVNYFDIFGVEHIPKKKIKKIIANKNVQTRFLKIQTYDSVMCRYFYIGFIDVMLKGKIWTDFMNLFLPNIF